MAKQNGNIDHIGQLKPDLKNARRHNPRNIGMLEDALHEVGVARSIVIDEHGNILAGNGVVEAAAQAGIERVQVVDADGETIIAVRRTGLTVRQKQRLALYDNRVAELADWSPEVLDDLLKIDAKALDGLFSDKEVAELLRDLGRATAEDPGPQIDRAEELRAKWGVNSGDLWIIPSNSVPGKAHRLLCGDSTMAEDVARLMAGERAEMCVTDPPYGVEYDPMFRREALGAADRRSQGVTNDNRSDWGDAWRLFTGDVLYVWHGMLTATTVGESVEASGFDIRAEIVWVKPHLPFGRGHYHARHESLWYAVRQGAHAHWVGDGTQTTVWEIGLDATADGGHGTQKPLECMAHPIRNHEGDVYDPFLGSGTTMVAAERVGRIAYGMEISEKYTAVVLERMLGMGLEPRLAEG